MSDIFISYASEDRKRILPLVRALEQTGWSVFWDRTIPVSKTWQQVIGKEVDNCKCMIVVWSNISIDKEWVYEEAGEGKRRNILFPILIDRVLPPLGFRSIQAAHLMGWDGKEDSAVFANLVRDMTVILGQPPSEDVSKGKVESKEREQEGAAVKQIAKEEEYIREEAVVKPKETEEEENSHATRQIQIKRDIDKARLSESIGMPAKSTHFGADNADWLSGAVARTAKRRNILTRCLISWLIGCVLMIVALFSYLEPSLSTQEALQGYLEFTGVGGKNLYRWLYYSSFGLFFGSSYALAMRNLDIQPLAWAATIFLSWSIGAGVVGVGLIQGMFVQSNFINIFIPLFCACITATLAQSYSVNRSFFSLAVFLAANVLGWIVGLPIGLVLSPMLGGGDYRVFAPIIGALFWLIALTVALIILRERDVKGVE